MLAQVLESEGFKANKDGYVIPESRQMSCFVSTSGEVLPVDRIVKVDLQASFVRLETVKEEHLYFAFEDVLGVRVLSATSKGLGFAR